MVESPIAYLQRFWGNHASVFMKWFLALPYTGQVSLLRNACPDLPIEYNVNELNPTPTQLMTPELNVAGLLSENGKTFLRLMNARARRTDDCARHDLLLLLALRSDNKMPVFSGDTFKNVSLAFIDPQDPEQNVQSLLPSASAHLLEEKRALITQGKLIEADVWLTMQMRQQMILTLLTNVAHTFETMFLRQVMMGEVTSNEIGCRYCGSATRQLKDGVQGEIASSLLLCACKLASYCCKEHQVADWKNHKPLCKQMRDLENENQVE